MGLDFVIFLSFFGITHFLNICALLLVQFHAFSQNLVALAFHVRNFHELHPDQGPRLQISSSFLKRPQSPVWSFFFGVVACRVCIACEDKSGGGAGVSLASPWHLMLAAVAFGGSLFHSLMVLWTNENCLYWVWHWSCVYWLLTWCWWSRND